MNFDFVSEYDVLGAFWMTVQLTFWSAIGALLWGTILAAMRVSPVPLMRGFGTAYVNIVRNIPLTLIILAMSVVLADTLGMNLSSRDSPTYIDDNSFRLAVVGFILYTATFVCEAIRSGINTVPPGQAEAARAIGLTFLQNMRIIVLPQAFRAVIGPLASVLIALTKNTTIASAIGVAEASYLMAQILETEAALFATAAVIGLGFIVLTLPVGLILGRVAKKVSVKR
ncbi:amino acid ABC transporter permease [Nakamurella sp. A5-74]|uniref:Amino acid ABC transporter permease n=1 Tax=Nakamurella sp. A5-74 TaxID=3158264 RepID=A0AAU8DJT8_9ACTN